MEEQKYQILFNNNSDEIYVIDLRGYLLEVNSAACQNLGYSRDELLQKRIKDINSEKYKHLVTNNIDMILQNNTYTYETEHIAKNGQLFQIEMKSKIIDYQGQKAIMSIARNITERKALEKKIISTVIETEEKERKRFAADLHDGLGPILSTIKLYADLLKSKIDKNNKILELAENIDELVELAIATSKEISNNITPTILHDFGLCSAISEFCNYINKTKSVNIETNLKHYNFDLRDFTETILYQVVKELINNTIKHANAQNIKIELSNTETQIILYYRDDGDGFDIENMLKNSAGLGLNNIINKIKTIKGACDFNSQQGEGMFVLIAVKIEKE